MVSTPVRVSEVSDTQLAKQVSSISFNVSGNFTFIRLEHDINVLRESFLSPVGIAIFFRFSHSTKAFVPIESTEFGSSIVSRLAQSLKACSPITFNLLFGANVTVFKLLA